MQTQDERNVLKYKKKNSGVNTNTKIIVRTKIIFKFVQLNLGLFYPKYLRKYGTVIKFEKNYMQGV